MRCRGLMGAAVALALLIWLPLGLAGVPLDTPDGFLHLGWAVGWVKQLQQGWLWPTWSDLPWAGAGSSALLIYPPLFRWLVGVPLLLGLPPDHALATGLLLLLLLHNGGVAALATHWLPKSRWRWALLIAASLNPYLLVNIYVRGAWPEALAQALLWWLALGFLGLHHRRPWAWPLAGLVLAGIALSNWNAALLTGVAWGLAGLLLRRKAWLWSGALGAGLAMPFWLPALQALPSVRPPIPAGLLPGEFFADIDLGYRSFAALLWIQAVAIALVLLWRWIGWRGASPLARWGALLALLSLLMSLSISAPIYHWLPALQRIQFPWRWLSLGWFGGLLWLASASEQPQRTNRARPAALTLIGLAAAGCWFDGLWRFRSNLWGHAPSASDRMALRSLLRCDPLTPCPEGVAALTKEGELAKRFVALPDGRIALSGVPDYSPAGVPEASWNKRLAIFWLPAWPQNHWAEWSGEGRLRLLERSPRSRVLELNATSSGRLRIMQWATPGWRVQVNQGQGWSDPLPAGGRDSEGWISVELPAGRSHVVLSYGQLRSGPVRSRP